MNELIADQKTQLICYVKNDSPTSDNSELALPLQNVRVSLAQNPDPKTGQPGPTRETVFLEPMIKESQDESALLFPGKTR